MDFEDSTVNIEISVIVKYGAKIQEVASSVQSAVSDAIAAMTGMNVGNVNVVIAGIVMPKDEV